MELILNNPLDTNALKNMINNPEDLFLVWPAAKIPFDHEQWREFLSPDRGALSFWVRVKERNIGHGALRPVEESVNDKNAYWVSLLYLTYENRNKGLGKKLIRLLEKYAFEKLSAEKLKLVVRTYNPGALTCYTQCGFYEIKREYTLITMEKTLFD